VSEWERREWGEERRVEVEEVGAEGEEQSLFFPTTTLLASAEE